MKNFKCHRKSVDIYPVLFEIRNNQAAWAAQTGRQSRVAVQAQTNAIPLRGLRRSKIRGRRRRDVHESRYTSLAGRFPNTVALLESLASDLGGHLGRAKFARLPPGARVLPHVDRGEYYAFRDRYHLVVDSDGESVLTAGDEEVRMHTGELWWFDNKKIHSAWNRSDRHRIHLVFDLQPIQGRIGESTQSGSTSNPRRMLALAQEPDSNATEKQVGIAVELYSAIRGNPSCWEEVLREYRCVERAQQEPLGVLAQLIWPRMDERGRKQCESAVAWALAQVDLARLKTHEIPKALLEAGGIEAIHRAWRRSKDDLLYRDCLASRPG